MKYIVTLLRILVGLLFIFSGFIKSNDPTGFSYKLDEYFTVFADDLSAKPDSLTIEYTSLDENSSHTMAIPADVSELQLSVSNSPWIEVEIDQETTIHVSSAGLQFGGHIIKETDMNASDSGEQAFSASVIISKDGQTLLKKDVSFSGLVNNNSVESISVAEYQKTNAWYVGFLNGLRDYALALAIVICVIEIILGIALLIGWAPRFTLWMLFLMLLFFAFLTWYSAEFDKVTDCGCFGDAIPLTPWQSFNKDLILLIATTLIFIGKKHLKPIFSNPFSVRLLTVCAILATSFSAYCWHYLPVKNFLQFKEGSDIRKNMEVPEGGRTADHIIREYIYDNNGEEVIVVWDSEDNSFTPTIDSENWTYKDVGEEKVLEERDEPPIHDFKIMDESLSTDYVEDFFDANRYKLMVVMNDLGKSRLSSIPKLKELFVTWKEAGHEVYILTASDAQEVETFRHEHQIDLPFYYGDKTNLKSIIRSNPGLLMVDSSSVVKTWPSTRLPKAEKLLKYIK